MTAKEKLIAERLKGKLIGEREFDGQKQVDSREGS